ncbi:ESX-1 secretion-associated protein [Mycobacterium sp. PS03-16]|uniref:ESX-1 secretion-associated protein n=1 Tax=Mycobacterium sp. PS03-16 TaxID=2559611 RepID=UPI0010746507|nr:ESX-1 secretion-associated protein [Mycobacterium sp. PS03-16]TFV59105.1 ESX-1 secretion-associated protein [Mycobacterium sp. PS03-16]
MTELRVSTEHVHELASRQGQAAARLTGASSATDGVSGSMWLSHGVVCALSNAAVAAAESARKAACAGMAVVSTDLHEKLGVAAHRYDETDRVSSGTLAERIQPR